MIAKGLIVRDLTSALAERSMLTSEMINSTIKGILSELNYPKNLVLAHEIMDELIRSIITNPFLQTERRRQIEAELQERSLEIKQRAEFARASRTASAGAAGFASAGVTYFGVAMSISVLSPERENLLRNATIGLFAAGFVFVVVFVVWKNIRR